MTDRNNPYGKKYWEITREQGLFLAALQVNFIYIKTIINDIKKDHPNYKRCNWEKLHVIGALDIIKGNNDYVLVRRGKNWDKIWDEIGTDLTRDEVLAYEILDLLEDIPIK